MSKISLTGERIPEMRRIAVNVLFTGSYFGKNLRGKAALRWSARGRYKRHENAGESMP